VTATLGDLAELAEGLESPALVVVGEVVSVGAALAAAASATLAV
jgi:siroheme synthase